VTSTIAANWRVQRSRLLILTETGEQHNLPVGELECVVMHVRLLLLDLSETVPLLPELRFGKKPRAFPYSTSFSNATSVPGRRHTATFGSPTAAKPPVIELLNLVDASLSPTVAGRDATSCRQACPIPVAIFVSAYLHGRLANRAHLRSRWNRRKVTAFVLRPR
jgi:hypothetical protein